MTYKETKVLIADDEENVRRIVVKMLDNEYVVLEAANGGEAVDTTNEQKPDLILMDIIMPKMDGYIACSKIKAYQSIKHIPIVMLTAVGQELNKKLAHTMGAEDYITKPFTRQDLLNVICRLLKSVS